MSRKSDHPSFLPDLQNKKVPNVSNGVRGRNANSTNAARSHDLLRLRATVASSDQTHNAILKAHRIVVEAIEAPTSPSGRDITVARRQAAEFPRTSQAEKDDFRFTGQELDLAAARDAADFKRAETSKLCELSIGERFGRLLAFE